MVHIASKDYYYIMALPQNYRICILLLAILAAPVAYAVEETDPLEGLNRKIYLFNKIIDSMYIKPATAVYEHTVPFPAKISVTNFIDNLGEIPVIANGLLQGKIGQALSDVLRFGVNSTLGIFGFFDVATQIGLEEHEEDLGKTLHTWGWKNSSYFVIPLLGPSTIRDAVGVAGNLFLSVPGYFKPKWRNRYYGLALVDRRQNLHEIESIVGVAGVEYYNLVRSGYFQHREYEITGKSVNLEDGDHPASATLSEPPA